MNPTQTGIAVAVAVVVVIGVFVFGYPLFRPTVPASTTSATTTTMDDMSTSTNPSATTTSPAAAATFDPAALAAQKTELDAVTQLEAQDQVIGTGATAEVGDQVTVNYVGALTNGTVFDASANHGTTGFTFTLGAGQVIQGWDKGVVGMKEGGSRILVIPASLGYGSAGAGSAIPPNATIVFQVQLLKVTPPAGQ